MAKDYFTRAEFRTFAGDPGGATPTYSDANIDAAQAEVIDHLEKWARSAWPNVTGSDGDGTAATLRTTTEIFDGPNTYFEMSYLPVASITSLEADDETIDADNFHAYLSEGYISSAYQLGAEPRAVEVTYTYGHAATPWAIKRPAMAATKALLDQKRGKGSKIPPRTSQYSTEGTVFNFDDDDKDMRPWPWDDDSSEAVRSYWGADRPLNVGAV